MIPEKPEMVEGEEINSTAELLQHLQVKAMREASTNAVRQLGGYYAVTEEQLDIMRSFGAMAIDAITPNPYLRERLKTAVEEGITVAIEASRLPQTQGLGAQSEVVLENADRAPEQ